MGSSPFPPSIFLSSSCFRGSIGWAFPLQQIILIFLPFASKWDKAVRIPLSKIQSIPRAQAVDRKSVV